MSVNTQNTLITPKLQVVYGRSTDQMTALLSKMSIVCVRPGYEIQLVSYGFKHALQSLSNQLCAHTRLKTTGCISTFCVLIDCSTIKDILCVF